MTTTTNGNGAHHSGNKAGGRVGIVGTGHRGRVRFTRRFQLLTFLQLYLNAVIARPASQVVAICDLNADRRGVYQEILKQAGQDPAVEYDAKDFDKMLEVENLDTLVVTTVDHTHDLYIIPALKKGIRVLTEKPMTT